MRARIVAGIVLTAVVGLSTPAAATARPHYSNFGNDMFGDCGYEAMANLTLHEYPSAHITRTQVVQAWQRTGKEWDSGPLYAMAAGFGGHRVASEADLTVGNKGALIYAANHGGVWATVEQGTHALAIIAANARGLMLVDDGQPGFIGWAAWLQYQAGGTDGHPLYQTNFDSLVALTWN